VKKTALIILAEGFEEIEGITVIDVLRRAEIEVVVAGLTRQAITGSHGIQIQGDVVLEDYKQIPDLIVLPGGLPGAQHLGRNVHE